VQLFDFGSSAMIFAICVATCVVPSFSQPAGRDASCNWWTWLKSLGYDPFCGAESGALKQVTFVRHDGYLPEYHGEEDEVLGLLDGWHWVETAKALCRSRSGCEGFTFKGDEFAGPVDVFFKSVRRIHNDCWTSFEKVTGEDDEVSFLPPQNGFFSSEEGDTDELSEDLKESVEFLWVEDAKSKCKEEGDCVGFSFIGSSDGALTGKFKMHFKSQLTTIADDCHTAYRKEYLVSTRPVPAPNPMPAPIQRSSEIDTARARLNDAYGKEKRLISFCVNHDKCQGLVDKQQEFCCPNSQGTNENCCDEFISFEEKPSTESGS